MPYPVYSGWLTSLTIPKMLRHLLRFTPTHALSPSLTHLLYKPHPLLNFIHSNYHSHHPMDPTGTIIFTTVGRPAYGFDVFSLNLSSLTELRLTDALSINFNAQFLPHSHHSIVFISERSGSPNIYLTSPTRPDPIPLHSSPASLFHDRPIISNHNRLYFISAHEDPAQNFKSWSALYTTVLNNNNNNPKCGELTTRLTPAGGVDYSPSVSPSGNLIAVASYGNGPWEGEFRELHTRVVVFHLSEPADRFVVSDRGGWPTLGGDDSTVFFHRQAEDGWWSIFRVEFNFPERTSTAPERITPSGVHCFTPAAFPDGRRIAVATRRRGKNYRHIEIFNLETATFDSVTELINPSFHHYNPFVSSDSESLGYHRFRGDSAESFTPHLEAVASPEKSLRLLRLNGSFPAFSPRGDHVAFNGDLVFDGLKVVRSDGSKRWTLIKGRTAFHNAWSPKEEGVIFTSVGPIFESPRTPVQIARVSFNPRDLTEDREEVTCEVKILTREDTGNNAFPACSPDGRFVVFRSGRNGNKNLYVVDAVNGEFDGGGSIRQLTDGVCIDTMPNWSPNGELIAFSSNRHNPKDADHFSIYLVRSDGSDLRRVYLAGGEGSSDVDRERINHVCFSPDGEWLLFTCNFGGVTAEPVSWPNQFQPYGDLYAARLDGSGLRRLTWNAYENGTPAWHRGSEVELGGGVGDRVSGQFDEPLWISCDI